jgi:LysM repeat protein
MVFKTQWKTYVVEEGDTFEKIGSKFNMTERALKRRNSIDKKKILSPGMKIKVRNRAFIEKNYLNQLESVLTDALKTRNH